VPGSNGFESDSNFKRIQIISKPSKLWMIQKVPSQLENFEIKFGCEGFEEGNNFLHRNFFRFEIYFK
jgi:hypothetical protein